MYIIDSTKPRSLLFVEDGRFVFECGGNSARADITFSNTLDTSRCYLNPHYVARYLLASDPRTEAFSISGDMVFDDPKSAKLVIGKSREAWSGSTLIRSISMNRTLNGDWGITNIQSGAGITRRILPLEPVFAEFTGAKAEPESAEQFMQAIPLLNQKEFAARLADADVIATAEELGDLCRAKWGSTPDFRKQVAAGLKLLDAGVAAAAKDPSLLLQEQLERFYTQVLYSPLVVDGAVAKRFDDSFLVAGRDPNRAVLHAEAVLGKELQDQLYKTLSNLVCERRLNEASRFRALDILGSLGLPDDHPELARISLCIAEEKSPLLRQMLATVRIRQLDGTAEDVALIRKAFQSPGLSAEMQGVLLEALFLAGATQELSDQCAKLMAPGALDAERAKRCQLAAPCSREGQDILIAALKKRGTDFLPLSDILNLLGTRIGPDNPQWPDLIDHLETIALDRQLPIAARVRASQIAATSRELRPFRERFIRQTLAEGERALVICAVGKHLTAMPEALVFVDDMAPLLKSKDRAVRLVVAGVLALRSNAPLQVEYHPVIVRFLEAIDATDDDELKKLGVVIRNRLDLK